MSHRVTSPPAPRNPTLRLLKSHAQRHWSALLVAAVSTVALTVAQLAAPWPLKLAIDKLVTGRGTSFELSSSDISLLLGLGALVLGIAIVDALASFYSDFALNRSGEQIVHDLRTSTYQHLQRLSLVFHSNRPTGDLVARVTGDVNAVGDLFAQTLGTLASSSLVLIGMFAVTFWIDPLLAFVAFLVTPLLLVTTMHYQKRIRLMARSQRKKEGEIASLATEALSAMQVIKAFGTERFEHDRVERQSAERLKVGVESSRVEARFGALVDVLGAIATALVLGLGVLSVAHGRISAGDLVVVWPTPTSCTSRSRTSPSRPAAAHERSRGSSGSRRSCPRTWCLPTATRSSARPAGPRARWTSTTSTSATPTSALR
jgi:ATP-binding cassette subfamily B protein